MRSPRVMLAAPHGRSGKTTVTIGIVAALSARGLSVQPFKKGPDYIDPSWLTGAGTRPCRNLDLFLMGNDAVLSAFQTGASGADISVIEGAMGLYDGLDLEGSGSSAALARLLQAPVLLVVDATRMTRSVAALVSGFQHFEPGVTIAGVILNNVARSRHERMLVDSIERYCSIPVIGAIPRSNDLSIPDRHLGLVPRGEDAKLVPAIERARQMAEERLDLGRLLEIAGWDGESGRRGVGESRRDRGSAGVLERETQSSVLSPQSPSQDPAPGTQLPIRIGVMLDQVFTFYYPENLEALRAAGADLVFVDSLADRELPDVDGLYIGGGFPEVFLERLEANGSLRRQIRARAEEGMPVYAECAGLIYLSRRLRWGDRQAEMVGVLPCEIEMTSRPQGHGYATASVVEDNPFFSVGSELRGHQFHNTRVCGIEPGGERYAFRVHKGSGVAGEGRGGGDGLIVHNVLATYTHLHALSVPDWAKRFVEAAERQRAG